MHQTNSSTSEQSQTYGYARMPRIIRKGYKDLSKMQKLLYIYLRDLCSENGMCYRSLRTLADETDFCISYLSVNIPKLAEAGLITAEMKKRNGKKWEIWHISIVDIWEANAQFIQSEKCSRGEQNESVHSENCSPDEQIQPKSVLVMNRKAQKCSRGTYNRESITTENPLLDREDTSDGDANASHHHDTPASPSRKKGEKKKPDLLESASPGAQAVIAEWIAIFKDAIPITARLIEHAETLAASRPVPGEIAQCRLWMYQTDTKKWYSQHGMHLGDVTRELERFRSLAAVPASATPEPHAHPSKPGRPHSSYDDPNYTDDNFYANDAQKFAAKRGA